jgi:hypothetical protein
MSPIKGGRLNHDVIPQSIGFVFASIVGHGHKSAVPVAQFLKFKTLKTLIVNNLQYLVSENHVCN